MSGQYGETLDPWVPYLLLAPAVGLIGGILIYPVGWALWLSFQQVPTSNLAAGRFVGLHQYVDIFSTPFFYQVLWNTLVFVGGSVIGQLGLGLCLAVLLDRDWPGWWPTGVFRASYILPWATTGVIVAYSWQFVFEPRVGLLNTLLRGIGVTSPPAWLGSVEWAMVAIVIANVWRGMPFSFVLQSSGLKSIPRSAYDAAEVGGATPWQTVRHVTLPLLRPFIVTNLILITIFTVNVFDIVFVMTGGGPLETTEVLTIHMYETAFEIGAFGRANALAILLFAINLGLVGLYLALLGADPRGVAK